MTPKKVALVVGSGGLKQLIAVPVIEYLAREGHQLAGLVGTSGGSLVMALCALGLPAQEILNRARLFWQPSLFRPLRIRALLGLLGVPGGRWHPGDGLIDGSRIKAALHASFGDVRMDELKVPLVCMATDLMTGEPVPLKSGRLVDVLYASIAQPPLLPAAKLDGRVLIDGGYTDSIAVQRAFAFEPDIIVSLTTEERPKRSRTDLAEVYRNLLTQTNTELERWCLANSLHKFGGEMIALNVLFERLIPYWETSAFSEILAAGETVLGTLERRLAALEMA